MQAFHSLFHAKPSPGTLSAELNAQIITVRPDGGGGPTVQVPGETAGVVHPAASKYAWRLESGHRSHIS
jgi:hypothetical protein